MDMDGQPEADRGTAPDQQSESEGSSEQPSPSSLIVKSISRETYEQRDSPDYRLPLYAVTNDDGNAPYEGAKVSILVRLLNLSVYYCHCFSRLFIIVIVTTRDSMLVIYFILFY